MSEASSITEKEWGVWRAFYLMHRQLDLALERQLQHDSKISAPDYEILLALFESPSGQLRPRELGLGLGWEKSRLSHQVTRMVSRGLVERSECETDARGTLIEITAEGRRTILGAMREHAVTVRRLFFDVLTEEEQAVLEAVSTRIVDAIEPQECDDDESYSGAA